MKKFFTLIITAALLMSSAACGSFNGGEYPVKIAGYTFNSSPDSVICLSDSVADILISCGYSDVITAKSDECTQEELSDIPTVGSKSSPNIDKINGLAPDVVFIDETVSSNVKEKVNKDNIKVLNMATAKTGSDITVLFESLGSIMEGNKTGRSNGEKAASSLLITLGDLQRLVPEDDIAKTACYLYNTDCDAATDSSFCGKLFEYANIINICGGCSTKTDVLNAINRDDPEFIFCPKGVKDKIMSDKKFADVRAVQNKNVYEIDKNVFQRQGDSMTEVLSDIIESIYPDLGKTEQSSQNSKSESSSPSKQENSKSENSKSENSKNDTSKSEESEKETSKQENSKTETSKTETSKSETSKVKADNSLKITEYTAFGQGDENDDIKKIQQRLKDLGYGDFKDGITNYFGEQTAKAFKAYQKNNGMTADGFASYEALKLLFSADVKPAKASSN